jgi:hypothetical protein
MADCVFLIRFQGNKSGAEPHRFVVSIFKYVANLDFRFHLLTVRKADPAIRERLVLANFRLIVDANTDAQGRKVIQASFKYFPVLEWDEYRDLHRQCDPNAIGGTSLHVAYGRGDGSRVDGAAWPADNFYIARKAEVYALAEAAHRQFTHFLQSLVALSCVQLIEQQDIIVGLYAQYHAAELSFNARNADTQQGVIVEDASEQADDLRKVSDLFALTLVFGSLFLDRRGCHHPDSCASCIIASCAAMGIMAVRCLLPVRLGLGKGSVRLRARGRIAGWIVEPPGLQLTAQDVQQLLYVAAAELD